MMKINFVLLMTLSLVLSCTSWSRRELTEYEKMQIYARDNHFEFIQRVEYEERKFAIKKLTKRKRIDFD